MGSWGVGILEDDFARDVYADYVDLHASGLSQGNIIDKLRKHYSEELMREEETVVFWLALANAQWEYESVDANVLQKINRIVQDGSDINRWRNNDLETIDSRKLVLNNFLKKMNKPRKNHKHKLQPLSAIFEAGDCLAVKLSDNDFGAALVLTSDNRSKKGGKNLIGILRYKNQLKPSLEVFKRREWLLLNHHRWENEPDIHWCFSEEYNPEDVTIEKVGNVEITVLDPITSDVLGGWNFPIQIEKQYRWENGDHD